MTATARSLPYPHHGFPPTPPTGGTGGASLAALTDLRARLDQVVTGGRPAGPPWTTRITPLDAALGGGVPRGRLTEVVGAPGAGKTALLKQVVTGVLNSGGWVAWIDSRRTLAPAPWAPLGQRLVVIRPHTGLRSAWCADLLLRSGVFSLVVIDGAPALSRVHGVRLAQLARERDAACVVLTDDTRTSRISGAIRLRVTRTHASANTTTATTLGASGAAGAFSVVVEKGGPTRSIRSIEVHSDISMAHRVCAHSEIPDRRGVARGTRRPWTAVGGDTTDPALQPVTWGGLAVSAQHDIHTPASTAVTPPAHRHAAGAGTGGPDPRRDERERERERERDRFHRQFDKHTRDWTKYRGRRRAADSSFGKTSRRERARVRVGADIDGVARPLGRVAESARR